MNRILLALLLSLYGCTSEQVYDVLQEREKQNCQSKPNSQYEDCIRRTNESYDEYKEKRDGEVNN